MTLTFKEKRERRRLQNREVLSVEEKRERRRQQNREAQRRYRMSQRIKKQQYNFVATAAEEELAEYLTQLEQTVNDLSAENAHLKAVIMGVDNGQP